MRTYVKSGKYRTVRISLLAILSILALTLVIFPRHSGWPAATYQPAVAVAGQISATNPVYLPLIVNTPTSTQPENISYWGMNLYLSKRERLVNNDNLPLLAETAEQAYVQWTREELPWDLIEPSDDDFQTIYDDSLGLAADSGFGIIGMLLTTPPWARDGACSGNFWCPPADVSAFAEFAAWMVERYDGDGNQDAPGSPRVAAWQIWNEPNDPALWPDIGDANARKRRYGDMLVAAYDAIKAADPTAIVVTGGVYVYDGSAGLAFLNAPGGVFQQVPAARQKFDAFALHPYIPTDRPDAPQIPPIITIEGRVRNTRQWLTNDIGRPDAPLWITEVGWCTAPGTCPGDVQVTEEQQANYLARTLVIAQQNGVEHTSWFQFEDAFNNPNREWSNAAIVRTYDGSTYAPKPAYNAYRTLAGYLRDAVVAGTGPLHTHQYDPDDPPGASNNTFNYRYTQGTAIIDVLWHPSQSQSAAFPVEPGRTVTLVDRDGTQTALTPAGGVVEVTLSERPILIVQE